MNLDKDMVISKTTTFKGIAEEDSKNFSLDRIVPYQVNTGIAAEQNNKNNLSPNLKKYYELMIKYKNGQFGDKHLSLAEILCSAGETDLLEQMSISEIQYLIDNSFGIIKMVFLELKKQKTDSEDYIKYKQLSLPRKKN